MLEIRKQSTLEERINNAMHEIVVDGKYPRAVRSQRLIELGISTNDEQAEFCKKLISDSENKYGRVLIVYRNQNEKSSSVRWFARGKDNELGETFVAPHIEPKESVIEVFELVKGKAVLAIYENDDKDSPIKFIDLVPGCPQIILPGQIHTVLCESDFVEVVEFKVVSDAKINPDFALRLGLVDEKHVEQSGPQIDEYLKTMHLNADIALAR